MRREKDAKLNKNVEKTVDMWKLENRLNVKREKLWIKTNLLYKIIGYCVENARLKRIRVIHNDMLIE